MGPPNVLPKDIFPIVTRLKPAAWELALKNASIWEEFNDIPKGLQEGFLCGLENFTLATTFTPENHFTSKEDEEFVISKYIDEIKLGRMSPRYEPNTLFSLISHYHTAPLAVIE